MSTAYIQEDIDDIENNLFEAEANLQSYVDSSTQAFRTQAMYRMNPWLASEPETVMAMAAMNIDTNTLLYNTGQAYGMQRASTLADDLRNKPKSTQRAIYSTLTPLQQDTLIKMGYNVPSSNGSTKSWYDGPLSTATAPFRWSISDVAIPVGGGLLKGFIFAQDQIYQRPVRTIAQLSTASKVASAFGAGAAGYAGYAGAIALGVANPLALAAVAGTAAVVGASAAAFLTETIQGNPSRFYNAYLRAGDGEKLFTIEAQNRARELLGDEALTSLAQTLASKLGNQTDLVALVTEMSGSRDALNPEKQFDKIQELAGEIVEPNTAAYFETVAALETIIQQPIFQEAIVTLQQGKISLGRVAARGLGLNPNSGEYQFLSGFVDAAYMIAVDPINLVAAGTRAFSLSRFGMEYADGGVMAARFINMYEKHTSVQRVFDQVAKGVVNGDVRVIQKYAKQWMPLYDNLRTYYNGVKGTADFAEFTGRNIVEYISDGQRFGAIMQGIGITQGVTRQTLKTLGPTQYALKTATGSLGDFLRGAGDASVYRIIEKISGNANFMDELLAFLPESMRDDFLALTQNTAYKTGLAIAQTPIVGRLLQPIGAFKEALVTPALTKQVITIMDKPQAVQDITEFVRSFQKIGLSSYMQDLWIKTIIDNPKFQGRIDAIASMIDSLATAGNMRQFPDAAEHLDSILSHFKQHYAFGTAGTMSTKNGLMKMDKVGALPILHNQAIMIGLPDMKLLRKAAANGSYFRVLLGIPETQYIAAFQTKIWKPSVLFRFGFAFRNSGEDILALIARAGSGFWLQEFGARNVGNYDAYKEAKVIVQEFNTAGINANRTRKLTERQKWILLKDYDIPAHIRPFARVLTRLGLGHDPFITMGKNYGQWLTTFLRGTNRQQTKLVDLMKLLRTATEEASSKTLAENLSLSPSIIKNNLKSMADMMIFGNEYSLRRMLTGGVNKAIIDRARFFTTDAFDALMDRLGTGSGIPLELTARTSAVERALGDKINVRLSNGEMGMVRQGENHRLREDFHVAVHERTSEMTDDALISPVIQKQLYVYSPDLQKMVPTQKYQKIIYAWKDYLDTAPDALGALDASLVHLWLVVNEPIEHPARVQRFFAALNQHDGGVLYDVLKNNYGGLRVPTPEEFVTILAQSDADKVGASAINNLQRLIGDIEEPAKSWVMANIFQDWATDGTHWGPEVMRWNGQSVGRSKGQPLYRMMQRPGDQYVLNPDGSLTIFFQEQGHWGTEVEALSFSLSHEQTLRYAQGVGNQPGIRTRPVVFTTTVDDTFAAHGITRENIGYRDYSALYDNALYLPYPVEGRGATFVQAPEGPYALESPDFRDVGEIGHRELALHAKKPQTYVKAQEEIKKLQHAQTEQEILLTRLETLYAESEPGTLDRTLFDQYTARLKEVEENIERSKDVIIAVGLDPINPIIPKEVNSITYPAGTYSLHFPDSSIYEEIDQAVIDELWSAAFVASETKVKEVFSKPDVVNEFNTYFKNFGRRYGTSEDVEILNINVVENSFGDTEVEFVFPNIDGSVGQNGETVFIPRLFNDAGRDKWEYVNDPKYPSVPPSFDRPGNVIKITIEPKSLMRLISEEMNLMDSGERVAELGRTLRTINYEFSSLSDEYKKLDSLGVTRSYVNNLNDPLGPESSRIAHLLTDDDFKYYTKQIDDLYAIGEETLRLRAQVPGGRYSRPRQNDITITNQQKYDALDEAQQYTFKVASEQLNQHNLIQSGAIKPGEIFADYSTSPFYSSFDEIQPAMEMEMARMIESGEFDDAMNLNRRVVDTGPTQEVFVLDTSNLPPYIASKTTGELPEVPNSRILPSDARVPTSTRTAQIGDTWEPGVSVDRSKFSIEELVQSAIDTRTPLVFSTRESAEFYLNRMNALLEKMTPYKPKGNVARNLEQTRFIPEVKSMYLPVAEPNEIVQLNKIFGFATENSEIPVARKMFSMKSKSEIKAEVPDFIGDTPEEAFDVIGWPVDNYPIVSEYLYDAATQGSQKQIIDAASETIKQRTKAGRRVDYVVREDDKLWILNEGRPMALKQGDIIPARGIYKDARMAEEDLVDLGDMRYMEETAIEYKGETDINWNIIAPLLYDQAEKLSGRKLFEGTQSTKLSGMEKEVYLDHIPVTRFNLHDVQNSSVGNLPNIEIASVLEDIPTGAMAEFDKAVQFGFNRVLAPIMDAISRKPMAFHAYSIAMEQNLKNIDWMLYDTPEEISLNALSDLFNSKSIFGPKSPKTLERWSNVGRQVGLSHGVPEAEYWSNGEAISYIRSFVDDEFDVALNILKNNPVDSKTNALVNFAKKNKGNVVVGDREIGGAWDFLDYMTAQLGEDVIKSGGAEWAVRQRLKEVDITPELSKARVRGILDNLEPEDWTTLQAAWNTREKALENARYYAQERTIRDVMPYIDSNEIRSQFAEWGRGFMPFFYAEENFIKRWARIIALDGGTNGLATLRQFQLKYTGLREMGVIREQPNGDDYFVVPGTDLMIDGLSSITGLDLGLTGMITQSTSKILPGFGPKFGAPSFSPLVIWPVSFLSGIFSDFEPMQALERNIVGEDNKLDRNWWDHFLPASMVNTVKAVKLMSSSQDELRKDEKLGSYFNMAMAHYMAQGKGPKPDMTAAEMEDVMRDVTNYARIMEVTRLLSGWVTMGPAGVEINQGEDNSIKWLTGGAIENAGELLKAEYYDSIRLYGIDDGTVRYINTYIDQGKRFGVQDLFNPMMYTTSVNETPSGAVIPSTKAAIQYYLDNKNIFGEYKLGSPWMIPNDPETADDFSQWAWNQSVVEGLRYRSTPQEMLDEFMFKEGATRYFAVKNDYEEKALIAEQSGDQGSADILREKWERFDKGWKASHPKFAEILTSNTRAGERKNIIGEIQIMLKDPEFPKTDYSDSMVILVDGWNRYMNTVGELSLNKTSSGRSAVAAERFNWQTWVEEDFLIKYPQLKSFWLGILKPESGLD